MKSAKRILSIALTLALGLALLIPAAAAEPANPNAPIITVQPRSKVYIKTGDVLKLEVEAELPSGSEGELSYEWYAYYGTDSTYYYLRRLMATGEVLEYLVLEETMPNPYYPAYRDLWSDYIFYAVVTNTYVDGDGQEQSVSVQSDPAAVCAVMNYRDVSSIHSWFGFILSMIIFPISNTLFVVHFYKYIQTFFN
ncbi:MAG: hypothetical protein FWE98_03215 [Oscillospiraceae bacterium]|nr:hypothetical protein [Oscillospiraceae bacterium]